MAKSLSDNHLDRASRPAADANPALDPLVQVGIRLREHRHRLGFTLQQVAERIGCARSYLSMIEQGRRAAPPSDELLVRLEHTLALPPGSLLSLAHWHHTPAPIRRRVEALEDDRRAAAAELRELLAAPRAAANSPSKALDDLWRTGRLRQLVERLDGQPVGPTLAPAALTTEVPLINRVAAGYPRDFTDLGYPARTADTTVRSPDPADPDAFACRVIGDSMAPDYREGDIVVFSPARDARDGADCFVRLEPDHESTFKRVFFLAEPGARGADGAHTHIRLQPLNPAYPPRTVPREQVAGLYPAVSITRKLG